MIVLWLMWTSLSLGSGVEITLTQDSILCPTVAAAGRFCSTLNDQISSTELIPDNSVINFMPGTHKFFNTSGINAFIIEDVHNITLAGIGGFCEIVCEDRMIFMFMNVTNLTISNLSFVSCGGPIPCDIIRTLQASESFFSVSDFPYITLFLNDIENLQLLSVNVTGYGRNIDLMGNSKFRFNNFNFQKRGCSIPESYGQLTCAGGGFAIGYTDTPTCEVARDMQTLDIVSSYKRRSIDNVAYLYIFFTCLAALITCRELCCCLHCHKLRDLSAQDKLEHQRVVKDLEKNASELNQLKEDRDKMAKELQEFVEIMDKLKEQVDIALGAEEMVEKLTDTNLELEEQLNTLTDTVADLEALRDLSEEQEELQMEVEHELREELDLSLNSTRQVERKLNAAQEIIIDQQQTIKKFRELVHNLQSDLTDLRECGERARDSGSSGTDTQKTIDFELRKLDAQQAAEHIDLLNSFMPNLFLVSGGDYDALLVLMLLPRLTFKADMLKDQLRQQHKLDEALGSLSTLTPQQADQLTFVLALVYKLSTLQLLVARATRILNECDVGLYRGVGGVRDDLNIHEKALDILIELLKKEQLDESVPLYGLDKAITHFENLLTTRLHYETPLSRGNSEDLLSRMSVLSSGCDFLSIELLCLRRAGQEGGVWATQIKEMESFNNDLRQACRKIRRKVPASNSRRMLRYDSTVSETLNKTGQRQLVLIDAFKALHLKASQKANSLTGSEKLTSGELEGLTREVVTSGALLEFSIEGKDAKEQLRANMTTNATSLDEFLVSLGEGIYDTQATKSKPEAPAVVKAKAVKAELSDVEGLGFKLVERRKDIMELKKALKRKGQELSEAGVKIGLLEKKVKSADGKCDKQVGVEREEQDRLRRVMDEQKRKFNKTIEVLENDKTSLEKKVEVQSKRGALLDITIAGRLTLEGKGSPYSSPFSSPNMPQTPLLLSRIESLKKALGFSQHDNFKLKAQIAKAQLNSLPPLHLPKRLIHKRREEDDKDGDNQTDQEKSVLKRTAALIEDIKRFSLPKVISLDVGVTADKNPSPREQLSNQVANIFEMQRQAQQLKEDVTRLIASNYPGGVISTQLASFTSPQFAKALNESTQPSVLAARLKLPLPPGQRQSCGASHRVVVSPAQFSLLHSSMIS
ncbi:dynactin subunit 1-like isoform X2 [Halichondria panicea]|uniref:dynactin subunit 1-like isoform X2 n=1 Tax=Halichondria panicea TaxID=6063 RepID=UPI00312BB3A0